MEVSVDDAGRPRPRDFRRSDSESACSPRPTIRGARNRAASDVDGARTTSSLGGTSSISRIERGRAELRLLDSFIDKLLDERPGEEVSGHEKSNSEEPGSEEFSREKSSCDSSIGRSSIEDSSGLEAASDDIASSELESFLDRAPVTERRDRARTTSHDELAAAKDGSSSGEPVREPKSKRRQKAQLTAVILSFPLRAMVCTLHLPIVLLDQIGTSIARAVRKDKSASAVRWPDARNLPSVEHGHYGRCMILHGRYDDARHAISRQIRVTRRNRTVGDKDVSGLDKSPTFRRLGLDGRLDIVAHGGAGTVDELDAAELVDWLEIKKLKRVGVLNIDSCSAGRKTFLEELGNEMHGRGIQFGWIAGSREAAGDTRVVSKLGRKRYSWMTHPYPWKRSAGAGMPASLNRKILKGNVNINFRGTVFDDKKPAWRVASRYSPLR